MSWLPVKLFGKPIRMLFRYGWLMSNLDFVIHTTGAILLISSGLLWLRTDGKPLNPPLMLIVP
jgi:hypothetical protein